MSVRLDTTPWFTKNLAAGGVVTERLLEGTEDDGRATRRMVPHGRTRVPRRVSSRAMLLALDIGNTNVTVGLVPGRRRSSRRAAPRPTARATRGRARGAARRPAAARRRHARRRRRDRRCASVVPARHRRRSRSSPPGASAPLPASPTAGTVPIADPRRPAAARSGADRLVNALAAAAALRHAGRRRRLRDGDDLRLRRAPTAPTSAARSRPGSSSGSRRSRHGPPSCRGSSCAPRTARSAATPCRPCSPGTVFGYQALAAGLLARIRRRARRGDRRRARPTSARS